MMTNRPSTRRPREERGGSVTGGGFFSSGSGRFSSRTLSAGAPPAPPICPQAKKKDAAELAGAGYRSTVHAPSSVVLFWKQPPGEYVQVLVGPQIAQLRAHIEGRGIQREHHPVRRVSPGRCLTAHRHPEGSCGC